VHAAVRQRVCACATLQRVSRSARAPSGCTPPAAGCSCTTSR
jgi:hypothetical protein